MAEIRCNAVFARPPEEVWNVVGDLTRVDWIPTIEHSELSDGVRTNTFVGLGPIEEQILVHDAAAMVCEYSVINSPVITTHHATLSVVPHADGSEVIWTTTVEPAFFADLIEPGLQAALVELASVLG